MRLRFRTGRIAGCPWGLVGAVVLALGVETVIVRGADRLMSSTELDWATAGSDAVGAAKRADVLIFGDSMVKFGVVPGLVESRLGRPTYGLALLNGRPAASYFLFRRALEAGARPRAVVVDYQPECMVETADHLLLNPEWKALLSARECWDLWLMYRDLGFFSRTLAARWLPSFRVRHGIRQGVLAALGGRPNPVPVENDRMTRNRTQNHGGMMLPRNPRFQGEVTPKTLRVVANPDWFSRPRHAAYVHKFLALASDRNIPVVWLLPPNAPRIERERARLGVDARYDRFIETVRTRYPKLVVVDARRSGYDHTVFIDPVHLDRYGATALSRAVAEVLHRAIDAGPASQSLSPRWVTLPRPDVSDAGAAHEDLEQSMAALQSGAAAAIRR